MTLSLSLSRKTQFLALMMLLLVCLTPLLPVLPVEADPASPVYVYVATDESYTLPGGSVTVYAYSSMPTVNVKIYNPSGVQVYNQVWTSNTSRTLPVASNAPVGYYRIEAAVSGAEYRCWFTVLRATGWSTPSFPYVKTHQGLTYTFYGNWTLSVDLEGDRLKLDLKTLRYLAETYGLEVAPRVNDMVFRVRFSKASITVDMIFAFIHSGCKLIVNGTLDHARDIDLKVSASALRKALDTVDGFKSGHIHFDWADLRRAEQAFTYDRDTGVLTVSCPQTFFLDPNIYEDGFESGDFSSWTGTTENTGVATVQNVTRHHGTWAMQVSNLQFATSIARADKNIGAVTDAYVRVYGRMEDMFTYDGYNSIGGWVRNQAGGSIACAVFQKNSSGHLWGVRLFDPSTYYLASSYSSIVSDRWYQIELRVKVDGSAGILQLWVDGVLQVNVTGIDTNNRGSIDQVSVGIYCIAGNEPSARTGYLDCAVVNNAYIGSDDVDAPTYGSLGSNATWQGTSCTFSSLWNDDVSLDSYIFSTNNTGSWSNDTATAFALTPGWANVSKTLNSTIGQVVGFRWFANDTNNNWNSTGIQALTVTGDTTAPNSTNISASTSKVGSSCTFSGLFNDDYGLDSYIFSTNNTGSWLNDTAVAFATTPGWANVSKTLNASNGVVVGYRWFVNDTSGNWLSGTIHTVTTTYFNETVSPFFLEGTSVFGGNGTWNDIDEILTFYTTGTVYISCSTYNSPLKIEVNTAAYTGWTYSSSTNKVTITGLSGSQKIDVYWKTSSPGTGGGASTPATPDDGGDDGYGGVGPFIPGLPPAILEPSPLRNFGILVIGVVVVGAFAVKERGNNHKRKPSLKQAKKNRLKKRESAPEIRSSRKKAGVWD